MVIAAPGIIAPVASITVPVICPVVVCAFNDMLKPMNSKSIGAASLRNLCNILPPSFGFAPGQNVQMRTFQQGMIYWAVTFFPIC
jgi:hypothetical protein